MFNSAKSLKKFCHNDKNITVFFYGFITDFYIKSQINTSSPNEPNKKTTKQKKT